ncbi:MAG: autotransporter assembly complex protein TamA, partial [Gammaproteobacteria bacterium]|nr:autotransporter assembly complex protein TamA [Gammaproteobacteria bacterium]
AGAADIRLVYDSGPRYRLGAVRFEGESPIGDALLERFVKFAPGTLYDADLLAAFNQDLIGSGYFAQVLVDAPREQAVDQVIPVIVQVSPRKPRTLGLGVGFSTDVGPRVRTTWQEHWVNDQGHRRGAEIEVSEPRQNLGLWYEFPLDPPTTDKFRLTSGFQREHIEDTDSRRLTLGGQWYTRLDNGWQQILSMRWEEERYAIGDLRGRSTLLLPGIGFTKTHSDQAIDPSRGYRLQLEVAGAQRTFLSDADILHVTALAKGLHTLGNGHRILGRAQVGLVGTNEFSAVPPSLRFFAGGDQSVRGYDYQSLSPRNAEGTVVGGRYLLVGSAEYQIPVAARWRVAAFVDEGNAIDSPRDPLQTGVGLGVRWVSPLGPLRLDLAYGLSESAGGGLRLHFSMGPEL